MLIRHYPAHKHRAASHGAAFLFQRFAGRWVAPSRLLREKARRPMDWRMPVGVTTVASREREATPEPYPATISGADMTTVAIRDGILAADSYATDCATATQMVKCARLPGGDVAGAAGTLYKVAQALAWLVAGGKGEPPDITDAEVLFTEGGVVYMADGGWPGVRIKGYAAIGSGAQGAMTAMRLGHSAEEAVRAVAGIDPCTGGEIDVLPVATTGDKARKPAVKSPRKAK